MNEYPMLIGETNADHQERENANDFDQLQN